MKNKENLISKHSNINKIIDEIEETKNNSLNDAEEFYNNIFELIEQRKKDYINSLTRSFNSYKRDLAMEQTKITQILETWKYLESKPDNENKNTLAIRFLQQKKEFEKCLKNHSEVLEVDLLTQKSKLGFSFKKEKFSLLQFLRSGVNNSKTIIIHKAPMTPISKLKSTKNNKFGDQSGEWKQNSYKFTYGSSSKIGNFLTIPIHAIYHVPNFINIDHLKKENLNVSKEYDVHYKVQANRSSSNHSRSTTKIKEFSSRITAPTKSSEMKFMHTKKPDSESVRKNENKDDNSVTPDEESSDEESDKVITPVVSFHASQNSDDEDTPAGEITPVVSASVEMYGNSHKDKFVHDVKFGILKDIKYDDFLKTPAHRLSASKPCKNKLINRRDKNWQVRKSLNLDNGPKNAFEDYLPKEIPSKINKTKLTRLEYFKTKDEEIKLESPLPKTCRKVILENELE